MLYYFIHLAKKHSTKEGKIFRLCSDHGFAGVIYERKWSEKAVFFFGFPIISLPRSHRVKKIRKRLFLYETGAFRIGQ